MKRFVQLDFIKDNNSTVFAVVFFRRMGIYFGQHDHGNTTDIFRICFTDKSTKETEQIDLHIYILWFYCAFFIFTPKKKTFLK